MAQQLHLTGFTSDTALALEGRRPNEVVVQAHMWGGGAVAALVSPTTAFVEAMFPAAPLMAVTGVWASASNGGVGLQIAQAYVRQYSNQPPPSPIAPGTYLFVVTINLGFAVGSTLATAVIDQHLRVIDATPPHLSATALAGE